MLPLKRPANQPRRKLGTGRALLDGVNGRAKAITIGLERLAKIRQVTPAPNTAKEAPGIKSYDASSAKRAKKVEAFLAASREGDFDALVAVLDPDVVLRVDAPGGVSTLVRGAVEVARRALDFSQFAPYLRRVLVNGALGVVAAPKGKAFSLTGFTVSGGKIVAMDILADPNRLNGIDLTALGM